MRGKFNFSMINNFFVFSRCFRGHFRNEAGNIHFLLHFNIILASVNYFMGIF